MKMKTEAVSVTTVSGMFEAFAERAKLKDVPGITDEKMQSIRSIFYYGVMECIGSIADLKKQGAPEIIMAVIMNEWVGEIDGYAKSTKMAQEAINTAKQSAEGAKE